MVNILNKKLNENKSFFSKNNKINCNIPILTELKSSTLSLFIFQNKYLEILSFCEAKTKIRYANPPFSKRDQVLEDKIGFSDEKNRKWFTFLPFETPNLLFLPKMGIVLLYSSSFSIINSF